MKRFFYLSVSILCLAIASLIGFYLGSGDVEAQSTGLSIAECFEVDLGVGSVVYAYTMLTNGDLYFAKVEESGIARQKYIGNVFGDSSPVNATQSSWGSIKGMLKSADPGEDSDGCKR